MDRLSIYLTMFTGAVVVGSLVITFFSFGWYGWLPVLISAGVGIAAAWPLAYLISRRIKRKDPGWDETRVEDADPIPRRDAPEV